MQCFSFSFPQPITTSSSIKQPTLFHPSRSISWPQNKGNRPDPRNVHASHEFPKVGATKNMSFQSQDSSSESGAEPELNNNVPKHVALHMDGSRRWAVNKGLPVEHGYRASTRLIKNIAGICSKLGVKVLSWFTISTVNWVRRPWEELDELIICIKEQLELDLEDYMRENIKVSIIGDTSKLPEYMKKTKILVEETTKANTGLHLVVEMNYGGRYDIIQAAKSIATKVGNGEMVVEDINEKSFEEELLTKCCGEFPHPDLLIRTGGEQRLSDFMLWQLSYTEFFFVDKFFPDIEEEDCIHVLNSFKKRHRRFGGHTY